MIAWAIRTAHKPCHLVPPLAAGRHLGDDRSAGLIANHTCPQPHLDRHTTFGFDDNAFGPLKQQQYVAMRATL